MAILAIRGHKTRGKEVIEILEMLGGINTYACKAVRETCFYFIVEGEIDYDEERYITDEYTIFTLEEFLEKFPYKIGNKVITPVSHNIHTIQSMYWDGNQIYYNTVGEGFNTSYTSKDLQPYKEENREEKLEQITLDIPDGYEFFGINDDNKVVLTKKHIQYPKTYEECCKIVNASPYVKLVYNISDGHKYSHDEDNLQLHENIRRLKICRDAYWMIMGLGKTWKPDWNHFSEGCYPTICKSNGKIIKTSIYANDCFLAFPTEEMRDAFYENFKSLIEECKELL